MILERLEKLVNACFEQGVNDGKWSDKAAGKYSVEVPKREGQGDYATNMAMVMAGMEKKNPRKIAAVLVELLGADDSMIEKVEIAGPGFVNIFLKQKVWQDVLYSVAESGNNFGTSSVGNGKKVMVEFVSANPTGPLS
ncbi:MAG TPA: arginine--tRNA ligase, partial [Desulfobacterales bacterium]|nr:arginine--tRNA ligase [Desulfobacterales bacterium]